MAFSSVCLCLCCHVAFLIRTPVTGFGFLIRTPICFPTYPNHISILEQEPIVISPFCGWLGSAGQFVLGPLVQLQLLLLSQDQVVSAVLGGDMNSHLVFGMWTMTASPFTGAVHPSNMPSSIIYQVGRGCPKGRTLRSQGSFLPRFGLRGLLRDWRFRCHWECSGLCQVLWK